MNFMGVEFSRILRAAAYVNRNNGYTDKFLYTSSSLKLLSDNTLSIEKIFRASTDIKAQKQWAHSGLKFLLTQVPKMNALEAAHFLNCASELFDNTAGRSELWPVRMARSGLWPVTMALRTEGDRLACTIRGVEPPYFYLSAALGGNREVQVSYPFKPSHDMLSQWLNVSLIYLFPPFANGKNNDHFNLGVAISEQYSNATKQPEQFPVNVSMRWDGKVLVCKIIQNTAFENPSATLPEDVLTENHRGTFMSEMALKDKGALELHGPEKYVYIGYKLVA